MVTTFYPPYHFGGDATYVRALAEGLVRRGHEVTVIHCEDAYRLKAPASRVAPPAPTGVQVHRLKHRGGLLSPLITQQLGVPGLKSRQLRELLANSYDVVNFHNISLVGGPGVIALSNARWNIYTLHEHWLLCPMHNFWKNRRAACDSRQCIRCCIRSGIPPQWWRYTSLIARSLDQIDGFIAPSEYTAARHRELLRPRAPIAVIPLFTDLSPPSPVPVDPDRPGFVYVGRMTASKGIDELLSSFAKWPDYDLTMIGEGELLNAMRARYAACANIRFLGPVPHSDLAEHYRRARALILPSLAPETFGLTVIEAFACGTPAIVKCAGGSREAIDNSGAGFVYENEAQLLSAARALAEQPALRRELGARARKAFEKHYNEEVHVSRYLKFLASLGGQGERSGGAARS